MVNKAVEGLQTKNQELLGKIKKLKDGSPDIEKLKAEAAEYHKLKTAAEEEKGEYKKLYEKQLKTASELEKQVHAVKADHRTLIKKTAITGALSKVGVMPEMVDIAVTSFLGDAKLDEDSVLVKDKPLKDFVKEWVKSDVGQRFIPNGNSGGGANGGAGDGESDNVKFFDKKSKHYSLTEQAKLAKKDPKLFATLKERYTT